MFTKYTGFSVMGSQGYAHRPPVSMWACLSTNVTTLDDANEIRPGGALRRALTHVVMTISPPEERVGWRRMYLACHGGHFRQCSSMLPPRAWSTPNPIVAEQSRWSAKNFFMQD